MDDTQIIDLYWDRDQGAITATAGKYGSFLHALSWNILRSHHDAEECLTVSDSVSLRAKDCVMKTANTIQENCGDIYAGAKDINEARAQKAAEADFEDAECTEAESADAAETVEE